VAHNILHAQEQAFAVPPAQAQPNPFTESPTFGPGSAAATSTVPPKPAPVLGYVWLPTFDARGQQNGWAPEIDRAFRLGGSGAAPNVFKPGELALLQAELAERERNNRAQEALQTRTITLDRALGSLTAFNTAQDIANQRRLTAFDQARQLAGFLVPKGTDFFAGLGPNDALAQVSQSFGLPFGGAPVVEQPFLAQGHPHG